MRKSKTAVLLICTMILAVSGGVAVIDAGMKGASPVSAIALVPDKKLKAEKNLTITKRDNIRWFSLKLEKGKKYYFESFGKGDPDGKIYKKSQVAQNGTITGDPLMSNSDDGKQGYNFKMVFSPKETGDYFLKILLFSGKKWKGNLSYKIL